MTGHEQGLTAMRDALVSAVNPDGGWGYYAGHASRIEATCWALLGLFAYDPDGRRTSDFLVESQRRDGLLFEPALQGVDRPNLGFNGLAALLFAAHPTLVAPAVQSALLAGIAGHKGLALPPSPATHQDNGIEGWAWIDSSFSWVEPTCWCALALERTSVDSPLARRRIDDAQRLLVDRVCADGGWNYGNSNIFGQFLRPYVSTTALGVLAMQRHASEPCVVRSLDWLAQHWVNEPSAMALGLTLISLRVHSGRPEEVEQRLLTQWDQTGFLGNAHLTGLALYSLASGSDASGAFRV